MSNYRLYAENLAPQLGLDWSSVTGFVESGLNQAVDIFTKEQTAKQAKAVAAAQTEAAQAQTLLVKAQTAAAQVITAAKEHPVAAGIGIGTIALIGLGAFLLLGGKAKKE
jgi:molybdenum cofactor biosynthesis enzyme